MSHVALPERTVLTLIQRGIDAISADLTTSPAPGEAVLDDILNTLDAEEKAKAREYWTDHPAMLVMGYPRGEAVTFPLYALTLAAESESNRYLGTGEHDEPSGFGSDEPPMGAKTHAEFNQWTQTAFAIWVYAEHPDICAWYYRILRRIMNVGIRFLIANGLDNPSIAGAEMAPDPRYTPDNVFVRRLTLTVEYDEEWADNDALWIAINGPPEPFVTSPDQLVVRHVDSRDPLDGGPSGGVVPFIPTVDLT